MSYNSIYRRDLFGDRIVVITGGGSGIGRCTAHELASLGAHVAIVGRNEAKLEHVRREIESDCGSISAHVADIRDEHAVIATVERVLTDHGRIDGSGQQRRRPISRCAEDDLDKGVRSRGQKQSDRWIHRHAGGLQPVDDRSRRRDRQHDRRHLARVAAFLAFCGGARRNAHAE